MDKKLVAIGARCELARRFFYDYCKLKAPTFYKDDRKYLKTLCDTLQKFYGSKDKTVLLIDNPAYADRMSNDSSSDAC